MNERPSFLEFPPLSLPTIRSSQLARTNTPEVKAILLSQSVDHALAFVFAVLFIAAGLSLFQGSPIKNLLDAGSLFWLSILATLSVTSFLYRVFCIQFMGFTPGNYLFDMRPSAEPLSLRFWMGQLIESLHLAFPALWALDFLARLLQFNLGIDYSSTHYAFSS